MANVGIDTLPSADPTAEPVAVNIGSDGNRYQVIKLNVGGDGQVQQLDDTAAGRLPVGGSAIGATNESAPAGDTDASGLNGRLQRIAQRLSTTITSLTTINTSVGTVNTTLGTLATATGITNLITAVNAIVTQLTTAVTTISKVTTLNATVPVGTQLSNTIDIRGYQVTGIIVPSTMEGTSISFQVSVDGSAWYNLYDMTNTQVVLSVTVSRAYPLWGELSGWAYVRLIPNALQTTTDTVYILQLNSGR